MIISQDTIDILESLVDLNGSIVINPISAGGSIRTSSLNENVIVSADVDEEFTTKAPIGDLSALLASAEEFTSPDFDFQSTKLVVSDGDVSLSIPYAEESSIITPPSSNPTISNVNAEFTIPWADLNRLFIVAGAYKEDDYYFEYSGSGTTVRVGAGEYGVNYTVPSISSSAFRILISVEDLLLRENQNYTVYLSTEGMSKFEYTYTGIDIDPPNNVTTRTVNYWVKGELE